MGGKNHNWLRNGVEVNSITGKDCREEMPGPHTALSVHFSVLSVLIQLPLIFGIHSPEILFFPFLLDDKTWKLATVLTEVSAQRQFLCFRR